jgi:hypothetical protein
MKSHFVFTILSILIFSSCTTSKILKSGVQPDEIAELQYIEPFSYISMIEKGNKPILNDSVSLISKNILLKTVGDLKGRLPVTGEMFVSDLTLRSKLEKEIEFLCLSADRQKAITNIKITPTIDSLLTSKGKRFGLITVSTGFTRTRKNYVNQTLKGGAIGILTLGMIYTTPIKAYSTIYVMIVDANEDNIAFYRKSFLQNEPLDEKGLARQFKDIFDKYFWITG